MHYHQLRSNFYGSPYQNVWATTPNVRGWNDQNALNILAAPHLLIDANWPCDVAPDQSTFARAEVPASPRCAAGRWDLASRCWRRSTNTQLIDSNYLLPADWTVFVRCAGVIIGVTTSGPRLLILSLPLKLSKRMWSRGGNVTVSGQILTHASCCDTATVANYIFAQWQKHHLGNIRMDGKKKNLILPTI